MVVPSPLDSHLRPRSPAFAVLLTSLMNDRVADAELTDEVPRRRAAFLASRCQCAARCA